MNANWVDLGVAIVLVIPLASGLKNGLVASLIRGATLLAAGAVAVWQMPWLAQHLATPLGLGTMTSPLAIFGAAIATGWILGMLLGKVWKMVSEGTVGWADRAAGGAVGLIKGAAISLVLLAGLSLASPAAKTAIGESWVGRMALAPVVQWGREALEQRIGQWRKSL